jgi:16S rRNA (uracil1498-N3)-methyltransferase
MDWAIQKAVEVGVDRLVPVLAERCQGGTGVDSGRRVHWQRVATQACKQCRRAWAMELAGWCTLDTLLGEGFPEGGVVADRDGPSLSQLGEDVPSTMLVGPEGGFSDREQQLIERCGWIPVRLGPHVLRAETAAVVGAALLLERLNRLPVGAAGSEE